MKLFVWRGTGVLQNYSSGIAFSLANNVHEARALLRQPIIDEFWDYLFLDDTDDVEYLNKRMAWLDKQPEVFDTPTGMWKMGGD